MYELDGKTFKIISGEKLRQTLFFVIDKSDNDISFTTFLSKGDILKFQALDHEQNNLEEYRIDVINKDIYMYWHLQASSAIQFVEEYCQEINHNHEGMVYNSYLEKWTWL